MMTSSIQKLWPFYQLVLLEFPIFSIETYEKEIAVILKRIDEIPQNLAKVRSLKNHIYNRFYGISYEGPVLMERVLKNC